MSNASIARSILSNVALLGGIMARTLENSDAKVVAGGDDNREMMDMDLPWEEPAKGHQ